MVALIGPAFTIAMLGAIESLLSAVVADGMTGTRHDSNQELIGQGIANIVAPLFGGFAATGAIARTATNIRNGGTSPLAGIVHAADAGADRAVPGAAGRQHSAGGAGGDPVRRGLEHERAAAFRAHGHSVRPAPTWRSCW